MKYLVNIFLLLLLFSCSKNGENISEEDDLQNKLKLNYLGYYESVTSGRSQVVVFDYLKVTPKTIQISATEELNLLEVIATNENNDSNIKMTILANTIGTEALYNKHITYVPRWPTYNAASDIVFEVEENNETTLKVRFSAVLEHWNEGAQILQLLVINEGTFSYNY
jgi:hypothetical protein